MSIVGSLGSIIFEVSYDVVRTLQDYKRSTSAKVQAHEIIGQKPIVEFLAPALDEITFTMDLTAFKGVNPKTEAEKLRKMIEQGVTASLVLAGEPISKNKWIIESMDESVSATDGSGRTTRSKVTVKLREYVENRQVGK
ncbi:MAG: phage tail protein [Acidaminococcaceae bacterium]